ncbi:MAG: hypothetical protein ACI8YP_003428 [Algoriphagus sp.]|jgi:hypothetical protein
MNRTNNFLIASVRYEWLLQNYFASFFTKSNELLKIQQKAQNLNFGRI